MINARLHRLRRPPPRSHCVRRIAPAWRAAKSPPAKARGEGPDGERPSRARRRQQSAPGAACSRRSASAARLHRRHRLDQSRGRCAIPGRVAGLRDRRRASARRRSRRRAEDRRASASSHFTTALDRRDRRHRRRRLSRSRRSARWSSISRIPYARFARWSSVVAQGSRRRGTSIGPDIKIGVRAGGDTGSGRAFALSAAQHRHVSRASAALYAAVRAGKVDGALAYSPRTTMAVANAEGKLAVATGDRRCRAPSRDSPCARASRDLLNYLNAWIAYWKADGWIDERSALLVRIARLDARASSARGRGRSKAQAPRARLRRRRRLGHLETPRAGTRRTTGRSPSPSTARR